MYVIKAVQETFPVEGAFKVHFSELYVIDGILFKDTKVKYLEASALK